MATRQPILLLSVLEKFVHKSSYLLLVFVVFSAMLLASLLNAHISYGDHFSDANALITGENFNRFGWKDSLGIPYYTFRGPFSDCASGPRPLEVDKGVAAGAVIDSAASNSGAPTASTVSTGFKSCADTHYPGLPYWVNGVLQSIFPDSLVFFRLVAILVSLCSLLLLPSVFIKLGLDGTTAILASAAILIHPDFLSYADSLHHIPLALFFLIAFCHQWLTFLNENKWRSLGLSLAFFFLNTWTSFENFAWIPVFAGLICWQKALVRKRFFILLAVGALPVATLVLRLYHHHFILGSWQLAVRDLLGAAAQRSEVGWGLVLYNLQKRMGEFFLPLLPLLIRLAVNSFAGRKISPEVKNTLNWGMLLMVPPMAWVVLMRQHFVVHGHPVVWFLPAYGVLAGALLLSLREERRLMARLLLGVTLTLALARFLLVPQWNRWLPFSSRLAENISQTEFALERITALSQETSVKTLFSVPAEAPQIAYQLRKDFRFFTQGQACREAARTYILILKDALDDDIERCEGRKAKTSEFAGLRVYFPGEGTL